MVAGSFFQPKGEGFFAVLTAAIADFAEHGFDSAERLDRWLKAIREAAARSMVSPALLEKTMADNLRGVYRAQIERGGILKRHPGVSQFTLDKVKPKLRAELDRRIMASAQLIKLNRAASIEKTMQRFSGWATSIPVGGSDVVDKVETKTDIRKALAQLPFEERRVAIDQGHKFAANLNDILAVDAGAIAGIWHSHKDEVNYNGRPAHNARDGKIFLVRGNWAIKKGLIKQSGNNYTDEIEQPGEFVYCRCTYQYLYALRRLPKDMLTAKGEAALQNVRMAA